MSSSSFEICPRSALRYRPIGFETSPIIQPWVRASRHLKKNTPPTSSPSASTILLTQTSSGLASLVALGMVLALLLILIGQQIIGCMMNMLTNWEYGYPRTFQTDARVGHGDSKIKNHFIALNNHGQIEVIEFPTNNTTHARIFFGPKLSGAQADLIPVTLRFVDSGHTGYPNMVVQARDISEVFLNRNGTFQPQP